MGKEEGLEHLIDNLEKKRAFMVKQKSQIEELISEEKQLFEELDKVKNEQEVQAKKLKDILEQKLITKGEINQLIK